MRKYVSPLRLGTSGSVRASSTAKSAAKPQVVQTFWPLTTHSSPSSSARVDSDARSDPAPGSLKSWHQISSARTIGGRKRSRCSSVPWANSAGAALWMPERVQPAEVVRAQLGLDEPGRGAAAGRDRRTPPARSARPARSGRTPDTRPRNRRADAPPGSPACPPAAASRQAPARTRRSTPAPRRRARRAGSRR